MYFKHISSPCLKKKNIKKILVDFKSEYNKTKISEMDISNIYLKKQKF